MAELVDFLPVDAAAWLEWRVKEPHTIRVDGPAGSGKTALLGAFAELVGDSVRIAGLADDREPLPYLSPDRGRHLTWIVPAFEVRGLQSELTHLLMRQAIDVVVADDPCAETPRSPPSAASRAMAVDYGRSATADLVGDYLLGVGTPAPGLNGPAGLVKHVPVGHDHRRQAQVDVRTELRTHRRGRRNHPQRGWPAKVGGWSVRPGWCLRH